MQTRKQSNFKAQREKQNKQKTPTNLKFSTWQKHLSEIKNSVAAHPCNSSYSGGRQKDCEFTALSQKQNKKQKGWGMTQVTEHLPERPRVQFPVLQK
jgi:hypothetical protein